METRVENTIPLIDTWERGMTRDPDKRNRKGNKQSEWITYYTETGDDSSNDESRPLGVELETNTQAKYEAGHDQTPFASDHISHRECQQGSKESTCRENRDL